MSVVSSSVGDMLEELADLPAVRDRLPVLAASLEDDTSRVDALRGLEELVCAAQAAQARLAVDLDASQRSRQAARGVRASRQGAGVAHQIGLARRESPHRAKRQLGMAKVLRGEMPHVWTLFTAGRINEWTAMVLVRETACLDLVDRQRVDALLAGSQGRRDELEAMSSRQAAAAAAKHAAELDPGSVARRRRNAESERRVTIRPAPDTMVRLSALLPVAQGVAVQASLTAAAEHARADGDRRTRGQLMADTLVERTTGRPPSSPATVSLHLTLSDRALLGPVTDPRRDEPAVLDGYGPVPASLVRDLVATSLEEELAVWLRRVYVEPESGALTGMDSRARRVPAGLARVIRVRDGGVCRTPWCDAPIRHIDHIVEHQAGGPSDENNLQGLCESCNYAKQAADWRCHPEAPPGHRHSVRISTPTGHPYRSHAPPTPGSGRLRPAGRVDFWIAPDFSAA